MQECASTCPGSKECRRIGYQSGRVGNVSGGREAAYRGDEEPGRIDHERGWVGDVSGRRDTATGATGERGGTACSSCSPCSCGQRSCGVGIEDRSGWFTRGSDNDGDAGGK